MPGSILRVTASVGATVAKGDEILVMDVMKMETPVAAPCDGTIKAINTANRMQGVQIGLVNVISNSNVPFFPIINCFF